MVHILEIHNSTLKSLLFHHIFIFCAFLPFAVFVFWIGNCRIWVVMSFMYLHRSLYFFGNFLWDFLECFDMNVGSSNSAFSFLDFRWKIRLGNFRFNCCFSFLTFFVLLSIISECVTIYRNVTERCLFNGICFCVILLFDWFFWVILFVNQTSIKNKKDKEKDGVKRDKREFLLIDLILKVSVDY